MNARIPAPVLNTAQALNQVSQAWDTDLVRQLTDYIAVPAKSPMFDADWAQHGLIDTVVQNAFEWVQVQKVDGLTLEIIRLPGRTPVLFFDVAASQGASKNEANNEGNTGAGSQTVLMYGTSTNNPNSPDGAVTWGHGRRSMKTASSMAAAVPTTVMPFTQPSPPSRRSKPSKRRTHASSVWWKPAKKVAPMT